MSRTTCCIVGGGPAGVVLALLLARSGVRVTVLEKHGDFLRDFRGDTVHPTTLQLLDQLGLFERFQQLPQRRVHTISVRFGSDGELLPIGDFSLLQPPYNYIAMVPQWDLLDMLTNAASAEPGFELRMNTRVTNVLRENGRVRGVRYRTADGDTGELRSTITIACDGRDSFARQLPELHVRDFRTPMDVQWFQVPRCAGDPTGLFGSISEGRFVAMIDRDDYFQTGLIIPKGTDQQRRTSPIAEFNQDLVTTIPWLDDGRELVNDWDSISTLHVTLDRLHRWHLPGLLCLGDAAHAMSPVGGIGINLAVQDAVAAARHLAEPLRTGTVGRPHVTAVQRRRISTTMLVQRLQRLAHARVVGPALHNEIDFSADRPPLPLRLVNDFPWLRRIPPRLLAYGALPERPPRAALR